MQSKACADRQEPVVLMATKLKDSIDEAMVSRSKIIDKAISTRFWDNGKCSQHTKRAYACWVQMDCKPLADLEALHTEMETDPAT